MTIEAKLIIFLWLLGYIHLWQETTPPEYHWRDLSESERITEWLDNE